MKKLSIILLLIVLIVAGGLIFAGNYFYTVAIARNEKTFLEGNKDLEGDFTPEGRIIEDQRKASFIKWGTDVPQESLSMESFDGLNLKAMYIPAQNKSNKTMIIAHGYASTGMNMMEYAKYFHETYDFNILIPDARGHGKSEGDYFGMGWYDRLDYLQWIDMLLTKNGAESQIGIYGVSMGGATVAMLSGENLPAQVKFIVEDCGYTNVRGIFNYQLKRMYNLPPFPLIDMTSLITKLKHGFSFDDASALKQVQKAKVPMIFIHGDQDLFVPFEMLQELYDAAPVEKELIVVPGAGHGAAFEKDTSGKIKQVVDEYIQKYMS